jgi:ABC-type sulfate transport system substrate-binding protein
MGDGKGAALSHVVVLSLASPQGQYRTALYDQWVKQLTTHQVPHSSEPTLIGTLGNPVKIRSWQVPTLGTAMTRPDPKTPTSILPSFLPVSEMPPLNPAKGCWVGKKATDGPSVT